MDATAQFMATASSMRTVGILHLPPHATLAHVPMMVTAKIPPVMPMDSALSLGFPRHKKMTAMMVTTFPHVQLTQTVLLENSATKDTASAALKTLTVAPDRFALVLKANAEDSADYMLTAS